MLKTHVFSPKGRELELTKSRRQSILEKHRQIWILHPHSTVLDQIFNGWRGEGPTERQAPNVKVSSQQREGRRDGKEGDESSSPALLPQRPHTRQPQHSLTPPPPLLRHPLREFIEVRACSLCTFGSRGGEGRVGKQGREEREGRG